MQDATYASKDYQTVRNELVDYVIEDIQAMNPERIEVRLELRYVERYKVRKEYECIDDVNKEEIIGHLSSLVVSGEKDEAAINFDVIMYGLMISAMINGKGYARLKRHVVSSANVLLSECATIPNVKAKIPELKELTNSYYWETPNILEFEKTRKSLRDIMKFIPPKKVKIHYTDFEDTIVFREEGRKVDMGSSDFEDYRARVNEYVEAHKNQPAINKLLHNKPISTDDYKELERIFTEELVMCILGMIKRILIEYYYKDEEDVFFYIDEEQLECADDYIQNLLNYLYKNLNTMENTVKFFLGNQEIAAPEKGD